jgi:hypothetical protein
MRRVARRTIWWLSRHDWNLSVGLWVVSRPGGVGSGRRRGRVEGVPYRDRPGLRGRADQPWRDDVRRSYWNELRSFGNPDAERRFEDARWSLLKAPENLIDDQAVTSRRLKAADG